MKNEKGKMEGKKEIYEKKDGKGGEPKEIALIYLLEGKEGERDKGYDQLREMKRIYLPREIKRIFYDLMIEFRKENIKDFE